MEAEAEADRLAERRRLRNSKHAESTGETLLDLVISDSDPGLGGRYLVTFIKRNRELNLPWNRLKVGTPVLISKFKDDSGESWSGVVSRSKRGSLQVSVNEIPDEDTFRIDLAADEITRKRSSDAIKLARNSKGRLGKLRDVLLGDEQPTFPASAKNDSLASNITDLNESQIEAVRNALCAHDVAIIHGPPGTGKTTTVVELIVRAIERGDKVLACAPSNTAVDNLVMKLNQRGAQPVRMGHPARVAEKLQSRTLDSLAANDPNMRIAKEMLREAADLFRKMDRYTRAKPAAGSRREMRNDAKRLRSDARLMQKQAVAHVLDRANIVCATLTLDDSLLGDRWFDLLVIDEACQSTEPPCWIPVCRSDKIVLAGDHCQLPPTVISQDAAKQGFARSMMERLMQQHDPSISRMLNIQYRMNQSIMQFSSQQFYDDKLISDDSVTNHLLSDKYSNPKLSEFSEPVVFVDTAGANWNEELEPGGDSRRNPLEAKFIIEQAKLLIDASVPPGDIAVITPYAAQVRWLREIANQVFGHQNHLEIDTVDGFQGREKEVVFISMVRSNDKGEIGFLGDARRMNVAMTRARRRLMMVGDTATIGNHEFYQRLLEHFDASNAYRSIWQFDAAN